MKTAIIVHGVYGYPGENWFPWMKSELEKLNYKVFVPQFPTPENQSLESWFKVFDEYKKYLNENSIIIGHSLGVPFLLNVLEKLNRKVKAAFFVAGFTGKLNLEFDGINKTFSEKEFNWKKIKQNCDEFFIFHSDNDHYVPLEKAKSLAKNLDTEVILVKGAGHFNKKAGYTKFELLLEKIKNEI